MGRRSGGDNVLEREGYAVSAGFALGLVALGMSGSILAVLRYSNEKVYCSLIMLC